LVSLQPAVEAETGQSNPVKSPSDNRPTIPISNCSLTLGKIQRFYNKSRPEKGKFRGLFRRAKWTISQDEITKLFQELNDRKETLIVALNAHQLYSLILSIANFD
jgi:hypothetical protein